MLKLLNTTQREQGEPQDVQVPGTPTEEEEINDFEELPNYRRPSIGTDLHYLGLHPMFLLYSLTQEWHTFEKDPLQGHPHLQKLREQDFYLKYPNMQTITLFISYDCIVDNSACSSYDCILDNSELFIITY